MLIILLTLILIRPFICSLAFFTLNYVYSIALLAFLIFWFVYKGISLAKLKLLKYPLALFILALIISVSFSKFTVNSIDEFYKYASGLALLLLASSLKGVERKYLIYCLMLSALIISFLAIHQYFFGFKSLLSYVNKKEITDPFIMDYIERKRVFFPFVTPNILGGYIAMVIPLCLAYKYSVFFIIPLFIALILTKSIGALLVLYLGLALYFYLTGKFRKRELFFLSAILLIIGSVFLYRATIQKEHTQPLFSTLTRFNYWLDALKIIVKSPLIGVGPGNFNLAQSRYAHNSFLQIWIEMGLLGITSFLWLIIAVLRHGFNIIKNSSEKPVIAGLFCANAVFLLHNLIDFSFFLPEVVFIWWLIMGLTILTPPIQICNRNII